MATRTDPVPGLGVVALAGCLALAACVTITRPANQSSLGLPVQAEVQFRSQVCVNTFRADVDGTDVTGSFSPQPPANSPPQATFSSLSTGQHTLTVRVETLQYWLLFPYCGANTVSVTFTVLGPPLGFSPSTPVDVNAGSSTNVTVTVSPAQASATTVNLASNSSSATVPATTSIPANTAGSAPVALSGQIGGTATITASSVGFQSATKTVNVKPVLTSLSPTTGVPGTMVTIDGVGFDSAASVRFGNQSPTTTFVSSSRLTVAVPNIATGAANVTATVGGQTSQALSFLVAAAPPPAAATLLFRSSDQDVQTFSFSAGSFTLLDTDPATPQGGLGIVGVAFNGMASVARTSSGDVQSYTLAANNTLSSAGAPASGSPSGTGTAIAAAGTLAVRAVDFGIETYLLGAGAPVRQTMTLVGGSPSSTGVGVDVLGTRAIRGHPNGVDVFNVATPATPTLIASAPSMGGNTASSVGVGVKFAPGGAIAVRSGPVGIDVYRIAANGTPTLAGQFLTGVVSTAVNTAVAINGAGTRAVRAHSTGIEVYDITNPASPTRMGQQTGGTSTTGVGAFIAGTTAFRATNLNVEAYDITNPAAIPTPTQIAASPSIVGVGLAGR